MTEQPPLRVDARTILEAVSSGLAFVLAGIAAVDLSSPYNVLLPLVVGAAIVMLNRLLGKNATDAVNELTVSINRLVASNEILKSDATPTVLRKADEAAEAIGRAPPQP